MAGGGGTLRGSSAISWNWARVSLSPEKGSVSYGARGGGALRGSSSHCLYTSLLVVVPAQTQLLGNAIVPFKLVRFTCAFEHSCRTD